MASQLYEDTGLCSKPVLILIPQRNRSLQ